MTGKGAIFMLRRDGIIIHAFGVQGQRGSK